MIGDFLARVAANLGIFTNHRATKGRDPYKRGRRHGDKPNVATPHDRLFFRRTRKKRKMARASRQAQRLRARLSKAMRRGA